jgi:hypothetical protein
MSNWYDRRALRQFITGDDVRYAASRNEREIRVPQNSTVTDEARELALKFAIRLDDGATPSAPAHNSRAPGPSGAPAAGLAQQISPDDTNRRIVEAVTVVLDGLDLGDRKAVLLPTIVRRVFAGLQANRS